MPTPLSKAEADDLEALLDAAQVAGEAFVAAEAQAKVTESQFNRRYRQLRLAHGASAEQAWDPIAKEWQAAQPQGQPEPQPQPIMQLVPDEPTKPKSKKKRKRGRK